jgi:AAA+ ATPase superfamily predicted ATPase
MGFLYEFLGEDNPASPLFGRPMPEIKVTRLDREKALEFLKEGFRQIGIAPDARLLEEAVEKVDGIIGWLTYLGVQAKYAGKLDAQILESALKGRGYRRKNLSISFPPIRRQEGGTSKL